MNAIKAQLLERLQMIRNLDEDHGGEGERAPNQKTFDRAAEVIESQYIAKPFSITVCKSTGSAVFEFPANGKYEHAEVTFLDDGSVSCYKRGLGSDHEDFDTHYTSPKFTVFFQNLVG